MLPRRARVVLDTLLPSGAHDQIRVGVFDAGWDPFYEDFRRTAAFSLRLGFRVALFVAIWISPLCIARIPPVSLYGRPTRERALLALQRSRLYVLRQLALLLKATVSFCYGAHPEVRDAIGFPRVS